MKYRGKLFGTDKWLYGDYTYSKGYFEINGNVVDVTTVGMFSGETDKSGKEIYIGDILGWEGKKERGQVVYDIFKRAFGVMVNGNIYRIRSVVNKKAEIIGNVYNTPELLKGVS